MLKYWNMPIFTAMETLTTRCVQKLRVEVLKALASHTRLHIIALLSDGEMAVCDIADALGSNQSTISCHLNTLRASGLVTTRREGNRVHYRLAHEAVDELLTLVDEILKTQCLSNSETLDL